MSSLVMDPSSFVAQTKTRDGTIPRDKISKRCAERDPRILRSLDASGSGRNRTILSHPRSSSFYRTRVHGTFPSTSLVSKGRIPGAPLRTPRERFFLCPSDPRSRFEKREWNRLSLVGEGVRGRNRATIDVDRLDQAVVEHVSNGRLAGVLNPFLLPGGMGPSSWE